MLVCKQTKTEVAEAVGRASPVEIFLHTSKEHGGDHDINGSKGDRHVNEPPNTISPKARLSFGVSERIGFRCVVARHGKREDNDITVPFYRNCGAGLGSILGPAVRRCRVEVFDSPFTRLRRGDGTGLTPADALREIVAGLVEVLKPCGEMRNLEVWLWVRCGSVEDVKATEMHVGGGPVELCTGLDASATITSSTERVLSPLMKLRGFKGVMLREVYDDVGYKHGRNAALRLGDSEHRGGWRYESAERGRITRMEAMWLRERGLGEYVGEVGDGFVRTVPEVAGGLGGV